MDHDLPIDSGLLRSISDFTQAHLAAYLDDLHALVAIDSGTHNKAGVDRVGAWLSERAVEWGWEVRRLPVAEYGDCRVITVRGRGQARCLLLGHMDTVYPDGTAAARPIVIEGNRLRGPGASDMKAGVLTAFYAVRALEQAGFADFGELNLFLNGEEEIGSPVSRDLYKPYAEQADVALVFEGARANGDLVSARKGGGNYQIEVQGKSAHAGVEPEKGANAIVQLARSIDLAAGLNGLRPGVTVSAGVVTGGTRPNVVPDHALVTLDVRTRDRDAAAAIDAALRALADQVTVPGTRVTVSGGFGALPMEKTAGNAALAKLAGTLGQALGFTVVDGPMTGGMSDANHVAQAGVPLLDGMGPIGGLDHSPDEYLLVSSIPQRTALAAALIAAACGRLAELRALRA